MKRRTYEPPDIIRVREDKMLTRLALVIADKDKEIAELRRRLQERGSAAERPEL